MTDFLSANSGFLDGMARTLDLGGASDASNEGLTERIAGASAVLADWSAVGEDNRGAIETVAGDLVAKKP